MISETMSKNFKAQGVGTRPSRPDTPSRNGTAPAELRDETARLLSLLVDGLGAVLWRFTQLEKAFQTETATVSDSAARLRACIDRLDRLQVQLDAEVRKRGNAARKNRDRRFLRRRTSNPAKRREIL
jgi:hypothetical protein